MRYCTRSVQSRPGALASSCATISESDVEEKRAAPLLQLPAQGQGVDHVAVVAQGQLAVGAAGENGLGVAEDARAGGGVSGVAYGNVAGEAFEVLLAEGLRHEAHGRA